MRSPPRKTKTKTTTASFDGREIKTAPHEMGVGIKRNHAWPTPFFSCNHAEIEINPGGNKPWSTASVKQAAFAGLRNEHYFRACSK